MRVQSVWKDIILEDKRIENLKVYTNPIAGKDGEEDNPSSDKLVFKSDGQRIILNDIDNT